MKLGFTLPNRGVLYGVTTAAEMTASRSRYSAETYVPYSAQTPSAPHDAATGRSFAGLSPTYSTSGPFSPRSSRARRSPSGLGFSASRGSSTTRVLER